MALHAASRTPGSRIPPEAEHNKAEYEGFEELYLNHGKPRQFGEIIKNPDLADTMEGVAKNGVDWFYNGPIADEMVEHINKNKGLFCKEDLINCKPKERIPVRGNYLDMISSPWHRRLQAEPISSRC